MILLHAADGESRLRRQQEVLPTFFRQQRVLADLPWPCLNKLMIFDDYGN